MSTFRLATRGVVWMLGAQVITSLGQFLYAALTARVFSPSDFGGFAASLSLTGLLTLLTTTGFPSYILMSGNLSRRAANLTRLLALGGGVAASVLFLVALPSWLYALKAVTGSIFAPALAISQAVAPIAAVESAILRREGRPGADATALLTAFVLSASSGAVAIFVHKDSWQLALPTVLYPVVLFASSVALRRHRLPNIPNETPPSLFRFSGRVTAQNVGFFALQQASGWVVSARMGAQGLGYFTRAGTLAGMPATALSLAINRAMQPHWRKLTNSASSDRAIKEASILSSGLAFFLFGLLATYGPELTTLWLGPGWSKAGELVPFMAVSYGISVPFTILANSAEMRGIFSPVRRSQLIMGGFMLPCLLALIMTGSLLWAGAAMAIAQGAALVSLLLSLPWGTKTNRTQTLLAVGRQAIWSAAFCSLGWLVASSIEPTGIYDGRYGVALRIGVGCSFSIAAFLFSARWNAVVAVLHDRGLRLPTLRGPA
ncbi:oligosaccharide flippase family protein [Paenarthrobacter sp. DKR-5]|nr:oligosaccharide flippase family protein [Paenarthrobacter sp. DKR-5]